MWSSLIVHMAITLMTWFIIGDLLELNEDRSRIDTIALSITIFQGAQLTFYFVYMIIQIINFRWFENRLFNPYIIPQLFFLNIIFQIFLALYGVIFYIIKRKRFHNKIGRTLVIVWSSVILMFWLMAWLFTIFMWKMHHEMVASYHARLEEIEEHDDAEVIPFDNSITFDHLPSIIYNKYLDISSNTWCIWLCEYEDGDVLKVLPDWFHHFHLSCIKQWFSTRKWWPIDKKRVTREAIQAARSLNTEQKLFAKIKLR